MVRESSGEGWDCGKGVVVTNQELIKELGRFDPLLPVVLIREDGVKIHENIRAGIQLSDWFAKPSFELGTLLLVIKGF